MNTSQVLADVPFKLGEFESLESFVILPISRSYEIILGMDFLVRNKMVLDCDVEAPCNISLRMSLAGTPSIASLYPSWNDEGDGHGILDEVYDLCAFEIDLSSLPTSPMFIVSSPSVNNILSALST